MESLKWLDEVVVVQVEVKDGRNLRPPYIYANVTREACDVTLEAPMNLDDDSEYLYRRKVVLT